jgi:transposase
MPLIWRFVEPMTGIEPAYSAWEVVCASGSASPPSPLAGLPAPVAVTYEAGPTGFGLARGLVAAEIECVVAAPSKLIRPAGDRVKTDARDALLLAQLLQLGQIVVVTVPSVEQESARDLVRAREGCHNDLMRVRHRISKLLLRQGIVYYGGHPRTLTHERWLRRQRFGQLGLQRAYEDAFNAMLNTRDRRDRLDKAIEEMAEHPCFSPVARRLGCLRGVSSLTAFSLAVEIGDWRRFSGQSVGAYVGLVPTEYSSGTSRVQGGLIQDRQRPCPQVAHRGRLASPQTLLADCSMRQRWDIASPAARARGHAGNRRLHHRWKRLR